MADLNNPPTISLRLTANTPEEFAQLIGALAGVLDKDRIVDAAVDPDMTSATATLDTTPKPKRKRGRPTKAETEAKAAIEAEQEKPEPEAEPEDTGVVQDRTPDEARQKAIELTQKLFAADASVAGEITAILKKYSAKKFTDISDADANKCLADVMLLANNASEAA